MVLPIGAQERVMDGVFCTVAVMRTAARSEEDWEKATKERSTESVRDSVRSISVMAFRVDDRSLLVRWL